MDKKYSQLEYLFVVGLYKYYVEHYRQKSFFYRAALIPLRSGSTEEGLKLLRQCAASPSIIQSDACIFLAHILMHHENKPTEALVYSEDLHRNYPNNMKVKELYAENLIRCKKYSEAIPLVATLESQNSFYFSGPAHFFEGLLEEEFYKNKEKAKAAYQRCTEKEYRAIEYFQKRAAHRLKDLD
jgi:predicted Zn-dependent protease